MELAIAKRLSVNICTYKLERSLSALLSFLKTWDSPNILVNGLYFCATRFLNEGMYVSVSVSPGIRW